MRHKHAEVLHAIADGNSYEYFNGNEWVETKSVTPLTHVHLDFRIKPKPPIIKEWYVFYGGHGNLIINDKFLPNIRFTFDGDTKFPIKVELI